MDKTLLWEYQRPYQKSLKGQLAAPRNDRLAVKTHRVYIRRFTSRGVRLGGITARAEG